MNHFSSVRARLVGIVFLAVAPALALLVATNSSWVGFLIGLLALGAAWLGGEMFIMRQVRALLAAAKGLAAGNLSTRTGLQAEASELGELAHALDHMAAALEAQILARERSQKSLFNRAHQQTVVAALGQFTLATSDFPAILNQAMILIAQTLEVDYCKILESTPDGSGFLLRAGLGWKDGCIGHARLAGGPDSQAGFTLSSGEPVVVADVRQEPRFQAPKLLQEHGVVSSVTLAIPGRDRPYGVLGVDTRIARTFSEEDVHFLLSVGTILAMAVERRRAEPEFQKLAAFAKFNPNPVLEFSPEGHLLFCNEAARRMASLLEGEHPEALLPPDAKRIIQTCLATGQSRLDLETRPGNRILSWSFYPIAASQVVHCYVEDTTARAGLEDQLRQAQKMESVGQLAAGVAHDFNNLLTVIQGHSGLLMTRPDLAPAMAASIQSILFATERATSLTRQLLLFSRKQILEPRPLDLNEVVTNLTRLLQRLLGETIELRFEATPGLPLILADAGMMEQILMNLAVNARDAMPKGGELLVRVDSAQIDDAYAALHPNSHPGRFVRLAVADTGCGMDAATMKRIFEPFFTTKAPGKGTGLGLATVYGIVRQHSGWIEVDSAVDRGTRFKIFLPAGGESADGAAPAAAAPARQIRGGTETVLLVEDEEVLREVAHALLQDFGYRVLDAGTGVEALAIWQRHQGAVDLLLTDMILPNGLSGKELAEALLVHKPGLRVIFTSGYSLEEMHGEVPLSPDAHFLQKPYTRTMLAEAVRACLDG